MALPTNARQVLPSSPVLDLGHPGDALLVRLQPALLANSRGIRVTAALHGQGRSVGGRPMPSGISNSRGVIPMWPSVLEKWGSTSGTSA